ncbi:MAG: MOSC N-terminal beta barrel domain-containing protein [Desulfurococcales archaeon]|nr:MOSC N-terminal beta barrel domain-containing protein [Desulfurococcales archaeon]
MGETVSRRDPFLYKILVYPIKSLPPVELLEATITRRGALLYDRVYAIVDGRGRYVNGKRERRIHLIRARYGLLGAERIVVYASLCCGREEVFELPGDKGRMERWLSSFLGYDVRLVSDPEGGFPDDEKYNGPTVVSTSTLAEVASWYPGWDISQARLRFRANLEIGGVEAFWEDNLYAGPGKKVVFRIGDVVLEGRNVSKRCVVPSRDPFTATATPWFQKTFVAKRPPLRQLPGDHNYRLAVNTTIPAGQEGKKLRVGDRVFIVSKL